jgi:aspartate racemase
MEQDFMKGLLISKYGLEIITPAEADRNLVHNVIYEELCLGAIREDSRKTILRIIENMQKNGAEGIILGCTELPLLIKAEHTGLPLFDTTLIHARRAVVEALA